MVMLAGGPGQPGAGRVPVSGRAPRRRPTRRCSPATRCRLRHPRHGQIGPLGCRGLRTWAKCAQRLGPRRDFYGTADHAEDIEAMRGALGYRSIGLFGTSYGTRLALAYAVAHPERVARLLLDSATSLREPDPFGTRLFSGLGGALTAAVRAGRVPRGDIRLRGRLRRGRECPRGEARSRDRLRVPCRSQGRPHGSVDAALVRLQRRSLAGSGRSCRPRRTPRATAIPGRCCGSSTSRRRRGVDPKRAAA